MPTETLDPLGIETGRVDPLGLEAAPVETAPPIVAPPVADWRAAAVAQMRPLGAQVGLPERPSHEEPLETPEEQAKRTALVEETRRAKGSRRLQELDLAAAKGLETGAQILSRMIPTTAIADAARALGIHPPIPKEHVRQVIDAAASLGHQVAQVPDVPGVKPELNQKISEGLKDFASEFISGFSSPEQAALIASGAKSPEVVARLFQIGSIASLPEATEQLKEAVKSGDAKQITKAGAGLGMSLAIPAAIERGLAPKPAPVVPPVTGRALELPPRIEPPTRPPEAAPVAPIAPVRPPTATETTPIVPPAEMPTTPTATGVRPAIRLVGGKVVVGDAGKTHPQILKENNIKRDEIDQRGFVNEQGQFMDREQTAAATGVPTTAEPARQHSTDLPEAKPAKTPDKMTDEELVAWYGSLPTEQKRAALESPLGPRIGPELDRATAKPPPTEPTPAPPTPAAPAAAKVETEVRKAIPEGRDVTSEHLPIIGTLESERRVRDYTKKKKDAPLTKTEQSVLDKVDGLELGHIDKALVYDPDLKALGVNGHKAVLSLLDRGILRLMEVPDRGGTLGTKPTGSTGTRLFIRRAEPKLEARAEGFTGKPLSEEAIWTQLRERHGIVPGRNVTVVDKPEATYSGKPIIDAKTRKVIGIELNRANIASPARLNWVVEHEVAHGFQLDNPRLAWRIVGKLSEAERAAAEKQVKDLDYSPEVWDKEQNAREIQQLAKTWSKRSWFEQLVGHISRYANSIGIPLSRLGAESAAVRALAIAMRKITGITEAETRMATMLAAEGQSIPPVPTGSRLIRLQHPDGTSEIGIVDPSKSWVGWGPGGTDLPGVARIVSGKWSHAPLRPGEKIVELPVEERLEARGPGAQSVGEPSTKAQIEQLEESFRNIRGQRVPFTEKIKEAFNLGERAAGAVNAVGKAVSGLKASGDYLISLWKGVPKIDELLRAKGELSKEMNVRGWHIRQTIRTMAKAVPRAADQAAIAKWIDAGGDRAALERGLAEAPDKYKQAYRDALNLRGDLLVSAQNAQNYFEARLQEAIDAGVLKEGVEDYLHRIYERTPERAERAIAYVQSALLKPNPSLARKRVFQWDWEAEKLGYKPVQSFIPRIAHYEASLAKAIASRVFIRRATEMRASDGRPVIDIKGVGIPIESTEGVREGTLIKPSFNPQRNTQATLPDGTPNPNYRGDYVNREYPSLSRWKWAASDAAGKPIFVQGDVAIHPEFVGRIDSLLKPSLLRVGKQAKIFRPLMGVSSTFKQTMLDLSGFHQVQITVHGLEHRVWALPTGVAPPGFAKIVREIDFADPNVDALLRSGVTLGGEHYMPYREGLIGSALTRHVPLLGPATETYHNWLFQDYIPRIKMTMALHALERNRARYAGKMTDEQILFKTAGEANAAFGELNYTILERSQTARDISRLIMLAPDFLEARARFAGAAFQRGGKMFGNEQRTALLFGALTMWLTARVLNKMISGQYHDEPENAFSIVVNGKSYGLRTVQGDIMHAATKPVEFIMHRLNPVYTRIFVELASGRDEFGRKRTPLEAVWDTVSNIRPIALRSSEERNLWESMANAFGITARRYNEVDRAFKLAQAWKSEHGVQERGEFIYDPQKDPLRSLKLALVRNDDAGATEQIRKLLESKTIDRVKLNQYFNRYATMPFTGSKENDKKFISTLSEDSRQTVEAAREHKKQINQLYRKALAKYDAEKTLFAPPARVPAGKVTYLDPLGIESGGP